MSASTDLLSYSKVKTPIRYKMVNSNSLLISALVRAKALSLQRSLRQRINHQNHLRKKPFLYIQEVTRFYLKW